MSWWSKRTHDPLLGITTRLADMAMQIGWIAALREQMADLKRENHRLSEEIKTARAEAKAATELANRAGEAANKVGEVAVSAQQRINALLNTGDGERLRRSLLDDEALSLDNPGVLVS